MKPFDSAGVRCLVEVEPLDVAILPLLGGEGVDSLKVDVEGSEIEVLKGATDLLKRTQYMIIEVVPNTESKTLEVLSVLESSGFTLIDKVNKMPLCYDFFLHKSDVK